jgi:hypothetical protein
MLIPNHVPCHQPSTLLHNTEGLGCRLPFHVLCASFADVSSVYRGIIRDTRTTIVFCEHLHHTVRVVVVTVVPVVVPLAVLTVVPAVVPLVVLTVVPVVVPLVVLTVVPVVVPLVVLTVVPVVVPLVVLTVVPVVVPLVVLTVVVVVVPLVVLTVVPVVVPLVVLTVVVVMVVPVVEVSVTVVAVVLVGVSCDWLLTCPTYPSCNDVTHSPTRRYPDSIAPPTTPAQYQCLDAHLQGPMCRNVTLNQWRAAVRSNVGQAVRSAAAANLARAHARDDV